MDRDGLDAEGRIRSTRRALASLLDQVPVAEAAKLELCRLMSGADRHYHNAAHLALLWGRHRRYAAEADLDVPDVDRLVACAIAFHDAIFEAGRPDNEQRSADLWMDASRNCSMNDQDRSWVATTILATRDHLGHAAEVGLADGTFPLEERARFWTLDLDLSPIGEEPAEFDANTQRLRAECPAPSLVDFDHAHLCFLRRFQSSPWIYRSPVLAAAFDAAARSNLARRLGPA